MSKTKCENCGLFCTNLRKYESEYEKEVKTSLPKTKTEWKDVELMLCESCHWDFPRELHDLQYYPDAYLKETLSEKLYSRFFE